VVILAGSVPVTVAGLEYAREKYGNAAARAELIAPAIRLAEGGFGLTPG
jgi:gamma-glutamyltranspeptidase